MDADNRPVILTMVRHYLPGYRAGGGIRSIANLVASLGDEFLFKILTGDRDFRSATAFPSIEYGRWDLVVNGQVLYLAPGIERLKTIRDVLNSTPYDVLYLNSAFDPVFTLWPIVCRFLRLVPNRPLIIAARGEFSQGSLAVKPWKKRLFIWVCRFVEFYRNATWQAASDKEAEDIARALQKVSLVRGQPVVSRKPKVVVAADICKVSNLPRQTHERGSCIEEGLRLFFMARIGRNKNLDFALRVLSRVKSRVSFSIVGAIEDRRYWRECQDLADELPANIRVRYLGTIDHAEVMSFMMRNDLLFLPSSGESFSHVIAESLLSGTPVLISDQTPWTGVDDAGAGWSYTLDHVEPFVSGIERAAHLSCSEWNQLRVRARQYAQLRLDLNDAVALSRELFAEAL